MFLKHLRSIVTDISHLRDQRKFSKITLIAEIAQYLQLPCLRIQQIVDILDISVDELVQKVNDHNELLHDLIIPAIFQALYDIEEFTKIEEEEVCLAKPPKDGGGYLFKVYLNCWLKKVLLNTALLKKRHFIWITTVLIPSDSFFSIWILVNYSICVFWFWIVSLKAVNSFSFAPRLFIFQADNVT